MANLMRSVVKVTKMSLGSSSTLSAVSARAAGKSLQDVGQDNIPFPSSNRGCFRTVVVAGR